MAFLNIYLNYMTPKTVTYILKLGIKSYEKKKKVTLSPSVRISKMSTLSWKNLKIKQKESSLIITIKIEGKQNISVS